MRILTDTLAGRVVKTVRQAEVPPTDPSAVQTAIPKDRTDFVTNVDLTARDTLRGQLTKLAPAV